MDKPYSLEKCKSFCNDGQVFPAMQYKIDVEGKPKKQAGREVEDETDGAVTAGRAIQVYRRRGGTGVPSKPTSKTMDMCDYFCDNIFHKTDGHHKTDYIKNLPREKRFKLKFLLTYIWLVLIHKPEEVEGWTAAAKEDYPDYHITNEWHEGFVHCYCPKCNGKKHDFQNTLIKVLKRPELAN